MPTPTLLQLFPEPKDLLALEPEELGAVLMEVIPGVEQHAGFMVGGLTRQLYDELGLPGGYPRNVPNQPEQVTHAIGEALSWLEVQGLLMPNPEQTNPRWLVRTRRGRRLRSRIDVETYRQAHTLPTGLLQPTLAQKVINLYARGDYDTAVFAAFKTVEVAIRTVLPEMASENAQKVVRSAFHPETGALSDNSTIPSERQGLSDLIVGAMAHAKNPPSHRDVNHTRVDAARLIVFASHLLEIVETRVEVLAWENRERAG